MSLILAECAAENVDEYTRFCAVLTAFAESDFNPFAVQNNSIGVYQQTLPFWTNDRLDVREACKAFLKDFREQTSEHFQRPGDPINYLNAVPDCWFTQQWLAPNPHQDIQGFRAQPETVNYLQRVDTVRKMLA